MDAPCHLLSLVRGVSPAADTRSVFLGLVSDRILFRKGWFHQARWGNTQRVVNSKFTTTSEARSRRAARTVFGLTTNVVEGGRGSSRGEALRRRVYILEEYMCFYGKTPQTPNG